MEQHELFPRPTGHVLRDTLEYTFWNSKAVPRPRQGHELRYTLEYTILDGHIDMVRAHNGELAALAAFHETIQDIRPTSRTRPAHYFHPFSCMSEPQGPGRGRFCSILSWNHP